MDGISQYAPLILMVAVAFFITAMFRNKKNNSSGEDDIKPLSSVHSNDSTGRTNKVTEKEKIKEIKKSISTGLADKVNPKDYQKVIIEQNEAIIGLLGLQVINSSGLGGDAFALIQQNTYYKRIEKYLKKEKDSPDIKKDSE